MTPTPGSGHCGPESASGLSSDLHVGRRGTRRPTGQTALLRHAQLPHRVSVRDHPKQLSSISRHTVRPHPKLVRQASGEAAQPGGGAWWWGGWGSNPRPRDYEVSQGPSLTCMIIADLPSDLRFHGWQPMAIDGPKRPFCGHRVGTVWARRVRIPGRGTWPTHPGRSRLGRSGGGLPAVLGASVGDAYTEPCLSR